jgi:Cupin
VTRIHDRASEFRAAESAAAGADPLSDVLRMVRLSGALFFLADALSPWVVDIPEATTYASTILPGAQQIVSYHIVIYGSCWGGLTGATAVRLGAGDALLIPHGDAYVMSSEQGMRSADPIGESLAFFRAMAAGELPPIVVEGGGGPEHTRVACGFLGCDGRPFNPVLATLPKLLHLRPPPGRGADRLTQPDRVRPRRVERVTIGPPLRTAPRERVALRRGRTALPASAARRGDGVAGGSPRSTSRQGSRRASRTAG